MFEELLERADEKRRHDILCAGIVAATMYNAWRGAGDKPITAKDFLVEKRPSEDEVERQAIAFFENLADQSAHEQARLRKN